MPDKLPLALEYIRRHPMQAARAFEQLPKEQTTEFIQQIPIQEASQLLSSMLPLHAAGALDKTDPDISATILATLKPGQIAVILRHLKLDLRTEILEKFTTRLAMMCAMLLHYSPIQVGAWMTPLVRSIPLSCTVEEARQRISERAFENFCRIYVVDDSVALKGIISPERLVAAEANIAVETIMVTPGYSLPATATLNAVADHPGWKSFDDLPVHDTDRKFVGVLRFATLRTGLRDYAKPGHSDASADTMMGFIEASMLGVTDIVQASLAPKHANPQHNQGE